MNKKAIVLLSGGLDSILATRHMMELGIEVVCVNYYIEFAVCGGGPTAAVESANMLGVPLKVFGTLDNPDAEITLFKSGPEPGLVRIGVTAREGETECSAEALITVTDQLIPEEPRELRSLQGLPAYTFERAPGDSWRSRFDEERNLIVIINAHRDFVFAARTRILKLRYICRLYAKELLLKNFPGHSPDRLLERMVELSLYTEEHLR